MYREKELLGKEVISSEGRVLGEVVDVTVKDDIPVIVVGEKRFLVGKDRVLKSRRTVAIPYYDIAVVHDKVMLSKSLEEIRKEF
jgi:sporulation protein YlmC with PRC-barrel domain